MSRRAVAGLLVVLLAILAYAKRPMPESDRLRKRCPLLGLNLGVAPFVTRFMTDDDLARVCGRDTVFDPTTGRCVVRRACDIDLSGVRFRSFPKVLREGECRSRGCSFDESKNRCDARLECRYPQPFCEANPNCTHTRLGCKYRSLSDFRPIRTCGTTRAKDVLADASSLCGPGTTFHKKRSVCEAA